MSQQTVANLARVLAALEERKLIHVIPDGDFRLTSRAEAVIDELLTRVDLRLQYVALIEEGCSAPTARLATLITGALIAVNGVAALNLTIPAGGET